jgi:hypothetical protein
MEKSPTRGSVKSYVEVPVERVVIKEVEKIVEVPVEVVRI